MQKTAPTKAPRKTGAARSRTGRGTVRRATAGIDSVAEFYAHAIAIEREAAERYHDLAAQMRGFGNHDPAKLFDKLAGYEEKHAAALKKKAAGMKLPKVAPGAWEWLNSGPTEVPRYEFLFRRVYTHHVLLLALQAERRAKEFFERIRSSSTDPAVKKLATEFAREEAQHMSLIELELEREARKPKPAEEVQ